MGANGDGEIDATEFVELTKGIKKALEETEEEEGPFDSRELFKMLDEDKNGKLTLEEIIEGLGSGEEQKIVDMLKEDFPAITTHDRGHDQKIVDAITTHFPAADANGDGEIDATEFVELTKGIKKALEESEEGPFDSRELFTMLDADKNGKLTLEEIIEGL